MRPLCYFELVGPGSPSGHSLWTLPTPFKAQHFFPDTTGWPVALLQRALWERAIRFSRSATKSCLLGSPPPPPIQGFLFLPGTCFQGIFSGDSFSLVMLFFCLSSPVRCPQLPLLAANFHVQQSLLPHFLILLPL